MDKKTKKQLRECLLETRTFQLPVSLNKRLEIYAGGEKRSVSSCLRIMVEHILTKK